MKASEMKKVDLIESLNIFEKIVYIALMVLLGVVIVFAIYELAQLLWLYLTDRTTPLILEQSELLHLLGMFLLVLIAVELLDTMKTYFRDNAIHVEVVLLIAIIAISRKVILLEPGSNASTGIEMIGIGIVIVGLAAGYYLIKKSGFAIQVGKKETPPAK